jgi:hypothetical protein
MKNAAPQARRFSFGRDRSSPGIYRSSAAGQARQRSVLYFTK